MPSHRRPKGRGVKAALIFMGFLILLPFVAVFLTVIVPNHPATPASAPRPAASAPATATAPANPHRVQEHAPAPPRAARSAARTYTVKAGNTLYAIAVSHHIAGGWQALYHVNHQAIGSNPNLIHAGLVLQL